MRTIHQPQPRAANRRMLRRLTYVFILLLTITLQIETFSFLNDPPGQEPQQDQLLTPSSTPEPRPSIRRLSIPDLVSTDEHFGKANTLQTVVDTFERAEFPGDALLMYDHAGEGEYLLSARPWEVGECRRANQELWDQLGGRTRVPTPSPARPRIAQPSALSYLTPPSSPEPVRKCDLVAPIAHVDPVNVPELAVAPDSTDFRADPSSINKSLESLSDYDYDDEWAAELPCTSGRCTPIEGELICTSSYDKDTTNINLERPVPTASPGISPSFDAYNISPLNNSTMCRGPTSQVNSLVLQVNNLTSQLDMSRFSEWPIARGGFGEIWKGELAPRVPGEKGRPIAVKRLTMYAAAGEEGARKIGKVRTFRELFIWSWLRHPNILPLMGICSFRGGVGIVSEWQENGNAIEWVRANPDVNRLELCKGICAGLAYLHNASPRIVHGDLRGANVTISKTGVPRLIDFGLASITDGNPFSASSTLTGTLRWMAPELQVTEGQGTTIAGDMFAFGMKSLI
ncbi:unnamed protein product [Rhizoctonia solani]|uniref:Protein kinase domain-containing protein n=1 Tax=Rhizoctonia solani TaxID=456999 RepID=A0A8H3BR53_9AGAM|nr:unnamed protein product [Rhizoctonia solani]